MEETSFPRGGTRPKRDKNEDRPKQKNLFSLIEVKKRKKQKVSKFSSGNDTNLQLHSVDLLAYNKIQPSMTVLACVKEILGIAIKVQLPGTLYADVQINAISDKLTNLLVKNSEFYQAFNLQDIFNVGDFVPIQVLENTETNEGNKRVLASINPTNVNSQNNCNSFRKGMLVWGAVLEKSDHVYSIDLGVYNTRCILNIKDIDEGKEFAEGQPLWLLIKNVESSNSITTVTVRSTLTDFDNYSSPICNLDILCPGSCVEVTCTNVLKSGLEVTFFKDCTGCINKIYLDSPQRNLNEFVNTSFKAYVLYKNPITKFVYFTMKAPQSNVSPEYDVGTVLKSKIIDDFSKGVLIQFENSEMGFVTFKRLIKSLKAKDNADLQNLIKLTYSKGQTYDCRIMDYSYMDQMYICTFEMDIIKEKYFLKSDLTVGEIVSGKIKNINRSGIVVQVGMVECFVANEHLTNVQFSENVKLRYRVGKSVKARVLSNDSSSVKLTLKPALLEDHECLTSYKQAKVNHSYLGVAVVIKRRMVVVKFYNDVKGIILDKKNPVDFTKLLYPGQAITVTVVHKKDERILLSIGESSQKPPSKVCVGQTFKAVISNVTPEGLEIANDTCKGFLPLQHLCADLKLSKLMIDFLKKDHELFGLLCLKATSSTDCLFSIRENSKNSFPKSRILSLGTIVRSSVNTFDENGLKLDVYTKQGVVEVNVDKKDIANGKNILNKLKLINGQPLLVKITSNAEKNKYFGTVKFSEVFNNDFNHSAAYLEKYLNDLDIIHKLSKGTKTIADYKIGQKVDVRVKKLTDIVCSVELADGTIGIAVKSHMLKNLKIGPTYTVRILFVNMGDNVLEVTFKPQIINQKFDKDLDLERDQEVFAKILLVRENFAVCSIKENGKKSFGFIPIKLNENDFSPNYDYYRNKNGRFRLVISAKTDFGVIGFPTDLVRGSIQNLRKRKLSETTKETGKKKKSANNTEKKERSIEDEGGNKNVLNEIPDVDRKLSTVDENCPEQNQSIAHNSDKNISGQIPGVSLVDENHSEQNQSMHDNNDVNMDEDSGDNKDDEEEADDGNTVEEENNGDVTVLAVINEKPPIPLNKKFKNPSMKSFFDTTNGLNKSDGSESESDNDTQTDEQPKKKKLTKKEQVDLLKKEEEELRRIELSYADMKEDTIPQTADQFDRRLLAEPNSSSLWIQYAALHISNTEIDKARTVFRRALQSINQTLTEDHLNVWTAYINLEHMYGTRQTFNDTFNEAVKYNDDLRVYIHAINALSGSQNMHDVDDLISKMVKKFKQEMKMYVEVAKIYYKQKRFTEARKLRSKALATIIERKKHIPLIVQFAKLEFDNGEDEYAETLFETILKDAPQRVDVWIVYVDQLVKKNKTDLARRVLQRAVGQKLKIAKMTSLCKKYVAFEKQHGNEETRSTAEGILNEVFASVKVK